MKRAIAFLAAGLLVTTMTPAALAQTPTIPSPNANDLGISENDVREEPSTNLDDNGFQEEFDANGWNPIEETLVLDAYVEYGPFAATEDVDNIRQRAVHGNDYSAGERHMYPGTNTFEAWWGWWADTGGGGDLQESSLTADAPTVGEPNGAIDDANDCDDKEWDEFTWRGDNPCVSDSKVVKGDRLLAFVQPGTHNFHINTLPVPTLGPTIPPAFLHNDTDDSQVPDFGYACYLDEGSQSCVAGNGYSRYEYDQSLLMTTQIASAANPQETNTGANTYDPFSAGDSTYMVDVDYYSTLHSAVEDAYRMTVWDPPQDYDDDEDEQNALSTLHENGLKQFLKDDGSRLMVEGPNVVREAGAQAVDPVEPQAGFAYDLFFAPRPHEPNHPDDDYNGWATFGPETTYGSLDGPYYQPGDGQTYDGYQNAEHTWVDVTSGMDVCPILNLCYHEWAHLGPAAPSSDAPLQDASTRGDHRSTAPGLLYVHANLGSWHDADGDTWVGDASQGNVKAPGKHGPALLSTQENEPYANGLIQDPNQYNPNEYDHDEWRPICKADWDVTLRSKLDTDGDGLGEWGTTGVYVFHTEGQGLAYTQATSDVIGSDAEPVLAPFRNDENLGGAVNTTVPPDEDGRLSRYRVEGPIDIHMRPVGDTCTGPPPVGSWDPAHRVLFPTGNPGYDIEVTAHVTVTEEQTSQHGSNKDQSLTGESITDVDVLHSNQDEVQGQPVATGTPLQND